MATIDYSEEEWKEISDGIDKLLDLEARQPRKVIKSTEFGTLEQLPNPHSKNNWRKTTRKARF